jgi:hypothetical protein
MPSAIKYIPPTDPARDAFSTEMVMEKSKRRKTYMTALKYFEGNHPEQLEYDDEIEPNDNTVINLVKITAERTVSFLFPEPPKFQTDPQAIDETPEEKWINDFFAANGGLHTLVKLGLRGFLAGHMFVRVKPGNLNRRGKQRFPKIVLLDPLAVTVFWADDDVGEVLWYENRYMAGGRVVIEDYVWMPDEGRDGEWWIYTYIGNAENSAFQSAGSPHGSSGIPRADLLDYVSGQSFERVPTPEGNEFARHQSPIPPIIEFAHLPHPDSYYGMSEATQTTLQDTINRLWSEINRIVRKHSDPIDTIVGADVNEVEIGDDVMTISNENAKVGRLEMKGDLDAAVATVNRLVETYLAVARVVLLKGEAKDLQRVTNASVRTLFIDALAKNEILRAAYGAALVLVVRLAMQMSGEVFASAALDMPLTCEFSEALPVDLTEVANINTLQASLGARSARTAATKVGDNWAFEKAAMEIEHQEKMKRAEAEAALMQKFAPEPANGNPPPNGAKKPAPQKGR